MLCSDFCFVWLTLAASRLYAFLFSVAPVLLELLQIIIPDRDARIVDAAEKLTGGAVGISAARLFLSFAIRRGSNT
jgi:VanZ family protein